MVRSFNSLLNVFLNCDDFDKFREILSRIDEFGKPDACTYNIFINGYTQRACFDDASKLFDEMFFPTAYVYASLIKAVCSNCELSLAFKLKDEAFQGKVEVDSAIYSTLISSLVKAEKSSEVSRVFEEMSEKGCKPDTLTYNVLINGFCLEKDIETAYQVLDEMVEKGLKPDVISYNMILGALFRI
ncbi:unnamed protein product [Cochlearia groenlandica]